MGFVSIAEGSWTARKSLNPDSSVTISAVMLTSTQKRAVSCTCWNANIASVSLSHAECPKDASAVVIARNRQHRGNAMANKQFEENLKLAAFRAITNLLADNGLVTELCLSE